jgi:catechol 2,3-dioxygenase-like lactoylglutathione lyase family enzyme
MESVRDLIGSALGRPRGAATNRTEVEMNSVEASSGEGSAGTPPVIAGEFKLEVVVLPVADVDRAKRFYEGLGWRLDADFSPTDDFRIVQLTPPGSACSIQFGIGVSSAAPGSMQSLYLAVADIEAARAELIAHGAEVSEVFHEGMPGARFRDSDHAAGPSPDPYSSFATFSDPDGNGWLLQEITARLPGR